MATKTFKIGLSNTDKQNMAQDVYERVEALLFAEYDSTETYHEGDYVVYNDALYKCTADSTTGTWDAAAWESATLQDLVDDVSGAVASVNGKANIVDLENGTLVVAKSLTAKELEPVSEESGDTQEEPFISQGTGTLNNTASVDTGSVAKQIEKQGNTIGYNQLYRALSSDYWFASSATASFSDGVATFTATAQGGRVQPKDDYRPNVIQGHKYLLSLDIKATTNDTPILIDTGNSFSMTNPSFNAKTSWETKIYILTCSLSGITSYPRIGDNRASDWDAIQVKNVRFIDLYQWFKGDIPQDLLDNPSHFSWYYNGDLSYSAGELRDSDGQTLTTTGRNLFDGNPTFNYSIAIASGQLYYNANAFTSDYIEVIPNIPHRLHAGSGSATAYVCYFDKDKNYISGGAWNVDGNITIPANCHYVRFSIQSYGTTYKNDVVVSLYYTTGDGYDQYYPYEEPKTYDTGTETLRSTGHGENAIKDTKTPDGTITRKVGSYTFTGSEVWSNYGNYGKMVDVLTGKEATSISSSTQTTNIFNDAGLIPTSRDNVGNIENYNGIALNGKTILVSASAISSLTGKTINYELATPATESGTPFAENIEINDYGMMLWDSDIPQGVKIFYPAWYVGFMDSLGQREDVDWDASNIVSQTQLTAIDNKHDDLYAIMQENVGGALRHQLASANSLDFNNTAYKDMGSLSWTYLGNNVFYAWVGGIVQTATTNILCPIYKTSTAQYWTDIQDKSVLKLGNDLEIRVKDTSYTDATAFKNAMKGILLAYEKA